MLLLVHNGFFSLWLPSYFNYLKHPYLKSLWIFPLSRYFLMWFIIFIVSLPYQVLFPPGVLEIVAVLLWRTLHLFLTGALGIFLVQDPFYINLYPRGKSCSENACSENYSPHPELVQASLVFKFLVEDFLSTHSPRQKNTFRSLPCAGGKNPSSAIT